MEVLRALYACASGLRFPVGAARSTLHILRLLCLSRLPRTRGESNPRPRDCESRRANHETTSKGHCAGAQTTRQLSKAISRVIKTHGATARALRHARSPQRVRRDKTNSHGASARARRHARSPQKVHPRTAKTQNKLEFLHLDRTISAEGRPRTARIVKSPQFFNLDHADPRRASREQIRNRKNLLAPRPRRSPQRVHPRTAKTQKHFEFLHLNHAGRSSVQRV